MYNLELVGGVETLLEFNCPHTNEGDRQKEQM